MTLNAVLSLTFLPTALTMLWAQDASPANVNAINNLGAVYFDRGQYRAAESAFTKALALWPATDPHRASGLLNLGAVLRAEARYPEAERAYLEALAIRRGQDPIPAPDIARVLHGLALLYHDTGRYAEAERIAREALDLRRHALGDNTPQTAASLEALGLILQSAGRITEALAVFQQALDVNQHIEPRSELAIAGSRVHLGIGQQALGNFTAAREYLEPAAAIYVRALPDHPATAEVLNSLAQVLRGEHDLKRAKVACEHALDIWRRSVGDDHPDYAAGLSNLGLIYQALKQPAAARQTWELALHIDERKFAPGHPRLTTDLNNLGALSAALHDDVAAEDWFLRAIRNSDGQPSQAAAFAMANLAELYKRHHRDAEARDLLGRAAAIVSNQETGDPRMASMLDGYATLLRAGGSYAEAADAETRAMRIRVRSALGNPVHAVETPALLWQK